MLLHHPALTVLLLALPLLLLAILVALVTQLLEGSSRRIALAGLGLVLASGAFFVWYSFFGPGRYAEFEEIQQCLRELPGVELLDASGHEDVTFEPHGFTIAVQGKGEIAFGALQAASFGRVDHMPIRSIGDHEVIVVQHGKIGVYRADSGEEVVSTGWGYGIDAGPKGPFARFFPFSLDSVQSVVEHYPAICETMGTWPVQPAYGTFEDEQGVQYFYAVKDPALGESWIDPVELKDR